MRTLPIGTITKSVNQQEMEKENLNEEIADTQTVKAAELKEDLNKVFYGWGKYKKKENCLYIFDNSCLSDKVFVALVKEHKIKLQLDLFT